MKLQEKTLQDWQADARKHCEAVRGFGKKMVHEAWLAGQALTETKQALAHGDFQPWLEENGISDDMASRYMRLFRSFQFPQVAEFASVNEALKAIAKPKKEEKSEETEAVDPEIITEEKLTPAEKRLLKEDALIQQTREAEEEKLRVEKELEQAQQKIKLFEEEKNLDEGFQRGASVLDQNQAEISKLRASLADKEMREKELMSENVGLKKALKQKDQKLMVVPWQTKEPPREGLLVLVAIVGENDEVEYHEIGKRQNGEWVDQWGFKSAVLRDSGHAWIPLPQFGAV